MLDAVYLVTKAGAALIPALRELHLVREPREVLLLIVIVVVFKTLFGGGGHGPKLWEV